MSINKTIITATTARLNPQVVGIAPEILAAIVFAMSFSESVFAQRPILLVTPNGVFQAEVIDGKPGPWVPMAIDVVVQGFGGGGGTVPVPPGDAPPADTAGTAKVAAISKAVLKDKGEATAVAAIIESLMKAGLRGTALTDALTLSAPLADTSLKSGGRLTAWVKQATAVTNDGAVLVAGLKSAFGITTTTLKMIDGSIGQSSVPQAVIDHAEAEAFDITMILSIIQLILDLLTKLGII